VLFGWTPFLVIFLEAAATFLSRYYQEFRNLLNNFPFIRIHYNHMFPSRALQSESVK